MSILTFYDGLYSNVLRVFYNYTIISNKQILFWTMFVLFSIPFQNSV